jgi:hypothetical protein
MRRFLRAVAAAFTLAVGSAGSVSAVAIVQKSPVQRAISADVVVVGKVSAIEKDLVEVTQAPGAPKLAYKIAVVKIEAALAGADGLTHIKVGFVPPLPVDRTKPPPPGIKPPIRRQPVELKEGQELLLFLVKHPEGGFYAIPAMSPPVDLGVEDAKKEIENVKKVTAVVADPLKALKSEKAEERYFAAIVMVMRYRSYPEFGRGVVDQLPIAADESRLLLKALAEGDWSSVDRNAPNGLQAFSSLALNDKDGWMPPKIQSGENYNKVVQVAFLKWLDGPGKDYQIKKIVPKKQ